MKLIFEGSSAYSNSRPVSEKISTVIKYLQEYGKASTAYNDLRPFVERLSPEERIQLSATLRSKSIFSDADKIVAGPYPAKEDVRAPFYID